MTGVLQQVHSHVTDGGEEVDYFFHDVCDILRSLIFVAYSEQGEEKKEYIRRAVH